MEKDSTKPPTPSPRESERRYWPLSDEAWAQVVKGYRQTVAAGLLRPQTPEEAEGVRQQDERLAAEAKASRSKR